MFGTNKTTDPTKSLEKELAGLQKRRTRATNRLEVAQTELPKAQAEVKTKQDADPATLKAARTNRRDWEDEVADTTAELAETDAAIAGVERKLADLARATRQREIHDRILGIMPRVDDVHKRLDEALAAAAEVYAEAAVESADFAGVAVAVREFREPLSRAIPHAKSTLEWLAARALTNEPPTVIATPVATKALPPPPALETGPYFTLGQVRFIDANDRMNMYDGKQRCVDQFVLCYLTESQGKRGLEAGKVCLIEDPRVDQYRHARRVEKIPAPAHCFSLDDGVAEAPVAEQEKPAAFGRFHGMPNVTPIKPDAAAPADGNLPPGFSLMPDVPAPYTVQIDPKLAASHRAAEIVAKPEDE